MTGEQAVIDFYVKNNSDFSQAMGFYEHVFLGDLIAELRPKKILEVGVSYGGTTALILDVLSALELDDTQLHSIDAYENQITSQGVTFRSGEMVGKTGVSSANWRLFVGSPAFAFSDELSDDYDLCIIDTLHSYPGELLDYLMVLPHLKPGATIIVHDLMLHWCKHGGERSNEFRDDVNCVFFSSLPGKKIFPYKYFCIGDKPNIGAVHLRESAYDEVINIFNALTLRWAKSSYLDSLYKNPDFYNALFTYFQKHYSQECLRIYAAACYKNLNDNIDALCEPSCDVCKDMGNGGATELVINSTDSKCQKCGSIKSERLLFNFLVKNFAESFRSDKIFINTPNFLPSKLKEYLGGEISGVNDCDSTAIVALYSVDACREFIAMEETFTKKPNRTLTVIITVDNLDDSIFEELKRLCNWMSIQEINEYDFASNSFGKICVLKSKM